MKTRLLGSMMYEQLGQQRVLHDLLQLGEVFLAEVPVSVGCSNPACVSLAGASEVAVSNKACTGCKVVYYCSRRCQEGAQEAVQAAQGVVQSCAVMIYFI